MAKQYDLVVIGSGPGGYVAAARAASIGLRTAIVEKDSALGGTCLHRGCIPTKALLHAADTYDEIKHASSLGIKTSGVSVDWQEVQKYKNKVVNTNALGVAHLMKNKKIDTFTGFGSIVDKNTVMVQNEKKEILNTKNILLAVGSTPRNLPCCPTKLDKRILNSDSILNLDHIPSSLTIVGGGVIGIEFASVFARFGTKVTVIEYMPYVLSMADEDCSKELTLQLQKQGVTFYTAASVLKLEAKAKEVKTIFDHNNKQLEISSEYVLVSVGRTPSTSNIGLENTKVQLDKGFIKVNQYMQTDESSIYAIGDCVNTPWLAHVASKEGLIAANHMAKKPTNGLNYDHIPSCVYSEPPVAWAGLSESEAKKRGFDVKVSKFDFIRNGKAAILGKTRGFVKFICDKKYGEILGVHIIGPQATELLAEASFAMQIEARIDDIADTVHAHPTLYEALYEAALNATDQQIHG